MAAVERISNTSIAQPGSRAQQPKSPRSADFELMIQSQSRGPVHQQFDNRAALDELPEPLRQRTLAELRALMLAIRMGETQPEQLTDLLFYARHPDLLGKPLTQMPSELLDEWNAISALMVHPVLNEIGNLVGADISGGEFKNRRDLDVAIARLSQSPASVSGHDKAATGRFDDIIARSVEWCPGLSPAVLKNLLAQESNFNPGVINQYGYAGIAQLGRAEAREAGLTVGIAGSRMDERLNPHKAIPAAARLLNMKAQRLGDLAFSRYGQPGGVEFWKFVLAAYNGGESTITLAMGHAHRTGLQRARARGLIGNEAISFARQYASKWGNLVAGGAGSPLGIAAARYFPELAGRKYHEISNYPEAIITRAIAQTKEIQVEGNLP
jgi:hypothetical protein